MKKYLVNVHMKLNRQVLPSSLNLLILVPWPDPKIEKNCEKKKNKKHFLVNDKEKMTNTRRNLGVILHDELVLVFLHWPDISATIPFFPVADFCIENGKMVKNAQHKHFNKELPIEVVFLYFSAAKLHY